MVCMIVWIELKILQFCNLWFMILVVYDIMVQLDFQNFACSLLYYCGYNILGTHGSNLNHNYGSHLLQWDQKLKLLLIPTSDLVYFIYFFSSFLRHTNIQPLTCEHQIPINIEFSRNLLWVSFPFLMLTNHLKSKFSFLLSTFLFASILFNLDHHAQNLRGTLHLHITHLMA